MGVSFCDLTYSSWSNNNTYITGSEGKLTLTEQKVSVLQAIGNMSSNAVSGATTLQDLAGSIVESFIPLLTTEGTFGLTV